MMETATKLSWALLALIHLSPAAAAFQPALIQRLYAVETQGPLGVLLQHRGGLFLAILILCLAALFDPGARRAASLAVAVSVIGFLAIYARAGAPAGALRTVALVDLVGLVPLALVLFSAWVRPAA